MGLKGGVWPMKVVHLNSMQGYKAPSGYRINSVRQLLDGSYEVTLEPLAWFL